MDDHVYYLRQRPNTFPVVPVSTPSAPIASSNIVRSQLPTATDLAREQVQFLTNVFFEVPLFPPPFVRGDAFHLGHEIFVTK